PGASCPLTFSTTGRAIEYGLQHMHVSYASRPGINEEWTQLAMSHGKLFLNLSGAAAAASSVLGVDVKSLGHSVCGRIVDELEEPDKGSLWLRLTGMIRLLTYLKQADKVIAEFSARATQFRPLLIGSSEVIAADLDKAQAFFYEAFCVHLQSSTTSGFASNVLQAMISGGQESSAEEEAEAARLMTGINGVESAILVEQLDEIVDTIVAQIAKTPCIKKHFIDVDASQAWCWLSSSKSGPLEALIEGFLLRHGHRGYRELCLREACWADAPETLIVSMQASVVAKLQGMPSSIKPEPIDLSGLSRALRWIVPKAHNAVRRREATKSLLVNITNRLKQSYRALSVQLVAEGKLDDADLLYFFTHQELMEFVNKHCLDPAACKFWQHKIRQRQLALPFQDQLIFAEISVGNPVPIDIRSALQAGEGQIVGRPVSRGVVEANARVAFSISEAQALLPGEILVAPITDVGWTPYFSMISGLITDVGSAVSHGAVIAREYGLPAIVNTRVATQRLKTGDRIRLDANTGIVTIL
ncbi:MAG: pyruvate, water dikinase, partial [Pseudomonadales bacterium]|nr:pyruvate, water dikinase [Pseudomonadales bacterium]